MNGLLRALERLTASASRELLVKQPHWGDAILCDGLLYAARALELARGFGAELEPEFVAALALAPSNEPELVDGAGVWEK
ncbi:MAG TPA: DUF3536 domain-containing protein, partial [Steroidobacteraceae bacterium]|nr:DUF3536 domain-containing protein [Steroidobacteraceae bacterium]